MHRNAFCSSVSCLLVKAFFTSLSSPSWSQPCESKVIHMHQALIICVLDITDNRRQCVNLKRQTHHPLSSAPMLLSSSSPKHNNAGLDWVIQNIDSANCSDKDICRDNASSECCIGGTYMMYTFTYHFLYQKIPSAGKLVMHNICNSPFSIYGRYLEIYSLL